ncbi:NADP-dependent oxidoreductase [Amorphoplanes digitatis]|uniref:NADPH-dependent curcumin reductase CurA n=1 Tax=Actinoplanes digitatis TaxID=1868 RepID=A0A7W7HY03_9ACTN|nr:NADP-dependent oxidoreductase [Actinoplanes digitatis]MBB4762864.1 NADPH-dependent curcumin reductase CurA [Actinoplanes digitatis]GID91641.1 NADP-dependent oxidoreductase [Actinoplanes digitatis]
MSVRSTEVRLAARPQGWPTAETFEIAHAELGDPAPGQVLVRNLLMSVDPYMRGRMDDRKSYVPPFQVGHALEGGAIGEVVESAADGLKPGDIVLHGLGWREYALVNARSAAKVDPSAAPLGAYLGVLGMTGLTAYAGLLRTAEFKPGDVVFVSSAAGAVGQVVGQLARLKGAARVIGSAGSAAKVAFLKDELGFDAAFDYHDGPVAEQLKRAAPDGVDVYFDNVGGEHLEAAISSLNVHGRITVCGMISVYNATEPTPAPRNLATLIGKRLTMRGMLVGDHSDLREAFIADMAPWVADGSIKNQETIFEGLSRAPEAFLAMLRGDGLGKNLVRIAE